MGGNEPDLKSSLLVPIFLSILHAVRTRSLILLIVVACILYQAALNVLLFHFPHYTMNVYPFHIINVVVGVPLLRRARACDDNDRG